MIHRQLLWPCLAILTNTFFLLCFSYNTQASPQNEDLLIVPEMEYCTSQKMHIFLGSIYMYKGVLMVSGLVLLCFLFLFVVFFLCFNCFLFSKHFPNFLQKATDCLTFVLSSFFVLFAVTAAAIY